MQGQRDPDQDQGFQRDERVDFRMVESKHLLQEVTIELPQAKELINIGRPTNMRPRCLVQDDLAEMPHYLSAISPPSQQQPKQSEHTRKPSDSLISNDPVPSSIGTKRTYNGRGKTLFDFFESGESFQPIFRKLFDDRSRQEMIYDYTGTRSRYVANIKVLEVSNDYDPKLYRQLSPELREMQPSYSDELSFDSSFECGNLSMVYRDRAAPNNFYCLLLNDSNTHGYTQWFCFRVRNTVRGSYTFHIMNQIKNTSMYKQGMKIAVFSVKQWSAASRGWFKGGDDITYSNTRVERTNKDNQNYYCLAFNYTFEQDNDTTYFALNQPYSYTRLVRFVDSIQPTFYSNQMVVTRKTIGYTLANNIISSLTIDQQGSNPRNKRIILIMARQHPGETVGSFVAEGLLEALSQPCPESSYLIKHFRIVVLPMVNPDGVIYGHSRSNLAGLDLNRQWGSDLVKELTPETHYIKKYIQNLHEQYGVEIMIDLHGHSKKMNSFFYACRKDSRCSMRLLSYAMSKLDENFDVYSCTYGLSKDKVNTVRSQLFNIGINAFTLENSYFGSQRNGRREHYSELNLKNIGKSLLRSLFVLYSDREAARAYSFNRQLLLEELQANIDRIECEENKNNKNDSGSESDPDGDLLALEERVKTMKLRDPTKKSRLVKTMSHTMKKKKFLSLAFRNKMAKEQAEEEQLQRRKKAKADRSIQSKPALSPDPPKATSQPTEKRRKTTRTSLMLNKRFERPSRTQTQSFKLSISKESRLKDKILTQTSQQNSKQLTKNLIPSRQLFEHPTRKKGVRQPLKLTRTEQPTDSLQKQMSVKRIQMQSKRQAERFMTQLDAIRIRLNRQQMLKSCDLLSKERSLDETQFMKIESLYRSKRQVPQPSPMTPQSPYRLSRKVSRSKKKFKVTLLQPTATSKYRKFESFMSETETNANTLAKNRATSFADQNSVFYHFPLL